MRASPPLSSAARSGPFRLNAGRALAAALALALALMSRAGSAQPPTRVFRVEAGEVSKIEIADTIEVTGSLESLNEMELSALGRGRITLAKAYEGMRVKKGDVIYQLDERELAIALTRAKAELDKALAEEKKMKSGSLPQEIVQARKAVAAAQARADAARDNWERLKPLIDQKIVSENESARAKSAYDVAVSEVEQGQAKLKLVEDGFRTEEVMTAEAEVKVRRAAVADIDRQLADLKIIAPEDAVIVAKLKEVGEWVNQGEPLARLITLDPLKLRVEAPQSRVSRIQPGQIARMTVDGLEGQTFEAEVRAVVPQAKPETRNFPVLLRVANPEGKLAAGMFTRVSLKVGEGRPGLSIPRHAMQHRGTKLVVFAIDPLPPGFKPPEPPKPDPKAKGPVKGGPPPGAMAKPDALARQVEIRVVAERERDLIVEPVEAGALEEKTPIVLYGASQLQDGSMLSRLNATPAAGMPGAG